jgi:hypothetical protein
MHCKFIKLTNGEDIIVQTDDTCDTFSNKEFISVVDPVLISSMRRAHGNMVIESYVMQPWLKMGNIDVVQLPTKNIVVAVDIHEMAEKQYMTYIEEYAVMKNSNSDTNFLEEADDETDDETFESLMETLDNNSDEEEDGHTSKRPDRTYH